MRHLLTPVRNTLQNMGQMGWLVAPGDGFGVRSRGSKYGASVSISISPPESTATVPAAPVRVVHRNPTSDADINSTRHARLHLFAVPVKQ